MNRRDFLNLSAITVSGTLLSACVSTSASLYGKNSLTGKNILVLGGTNFLGPAVVEEALQRGHNVTLFNRGITRPELFLDIEKLTGNRLKEVRDLKALEGNRKWDAVLDLWPKDSALVDDTTALLRDRTDYYYFVSSIAVYSDYSQVGINEQSPVHEGSGWYGSEKAFSEKLIAERFPLRNGVSRCHAIVGPKDNGVAFHYWLRRLATQNRVMAPGTGLDPVQFSDVRDVATWIVYCAETKNNGTYNICGSSPPIVFRDFLNEIRKAIDSQSELIWVDADYLRKQQGLSSFSQIPMWAPLDEDEGFFQISGQKAIDAGASFRPLATTAQDGWRWFQSYYFNDVTFPVNGWGLSVEQENQVLDSWLKQKG